MSTRALIVEDDENMRRLLVRVLRDSEREIEAVGDGLEALARVDQAHFDVVVSDLAMPGLDGIGLLRRLHERDPDLPVILMTGSPSVESAQEAVELRATRYLLKPLDASTLREAVSRAVVEGRAARAARQRDPELTALADAFTKACDTLTMVFQPIVRWRARERYAYEALVRTGSKALPHPGALFDAAGQLGRIGELGRIIRAAVAAEAPAAPPGMLFVNVHPFELEDEQLYDPSAPLSQLAGRVVLEITERAALDTLAGGVAPRVEALRKMGYRIAVDDLGAGYAGLTSVAQLEPEVVKLDMSLVRGVDADRTRQTLVRSMIQLFSQLGRDVIAEGVETRAEAETLVSLGCELLQGYLIARPSRGFVTPTY